MASIFVFSACRVTTGNIEDLKQKAEILFEKISNGNARNEFSPKYFPIDQTDAIMFDLKNKCDFKNRKGHFVNEYYSKNKSHISLIYEYYLKCDSIRFILTYKIADSIYLNEFKMEPIEKDNPMITDQSKRLTF